MSEEGEASHQFDAVMPEMEEESRNKTPISDLPYPAEEHELEMPLGEFSPIATSSLASDNVTAIVHSLIDSLIDSIVGDDQETPMVYREEEERLGSSYTYSDEYWEEEQSTSEEGTSPSTSDKRVKTIKFERGTNLTSRRTTATNSQTALAVSFAVKKQEGRVVEFEKDGCRFFLDVPCFAEIFVDNILDEAVGKFCYFIRLTFKY